METVNSLGNFERVADCVADWAVHLGQHCRRLNALFFAHRYLYCTQN